MFPKVYAHSFIHQIRDRLGRRVARDTSGLKYHPQIEGDGHHFQQRGYSWPWTVGLGFI